MVRSCAWLTSGDGALAVAPVTECMFDAHTRCRQQRRRAGVGRAGERGARERGAGRRVAREGGAEREGEGMRSFESGGGGGGSRRRGRVSAEWEGHGAASCCEGEEAGPLGKAEAGRLLGRESGGTLVASSHCADGTLGRRCGSRRGGGRGGCVRECGGVTVWGAGAGAAIVARRVWVRRRWGGRG